MFLFNWAVIGIFETIRFTENLKWETLPTYSFFLKWYILIYKMAAFFIISYGNHPIFHNEFIF